MRRGYYFRKFLDYLGVTLLLSLLYFLWVLYQGPLSVPFLKPYIVEALNSKQTEYTMNIGEVNLELVRSIQPVKIIAKDVVLRKNDGNISINTPKLMLSFSIRALLKGMIAPSNVSIMDPVLSVFTTYGVEKNKENEVNKKKIAFYFDWFEEFLERYNSEDKAYPESYINSIKITNASIEFHEVDLGQKWQFSNAYLNFNRHLTNLGLSAGGVVDLGDRMATLKLDTQYNLFNQKLTTKFNFSDVVISDFIKELGPVSSIDVPMEGEITAYIHFDEILKHKDNFVQSTDTALEKVDFKFKGSDGVICFEKDEQFNYDISSFAFEGEIKGGLDLIELKKAELVMADKKVILGFKASGYQKYFFEKSLEDLKITLTAKVDQFLMNDLSKFWPKYFALAAWKWCKDGLYGGTYENAKFEFDWQYNKIKNNLELSKLKGDVDIKDGTVFYLTGMPEVEKVYGHAVFDESSIDIDIDKGISDGLMIDHGRVLLYDLNKDNNFIDIQIAGDTSVGDALRYINYPPLEFADELGLDPQKIKGSVNINLGLKFELYEDLKGEEIKVDVDARLKDVEVQNVMQNKSFKAPEMDLYIKNSLLTAKGQGDLDSIALKFDFEKSFKDEHQAKGHFVFAFDEKTKQKLGLSNSMLQEPYLSGSTEIAADVQFQTNDRILVSAGADLKNMALNYDFLGLNKEKGKEGQIKATIALKDGKIDQISSFDLKKTDFSVLGKVYFNKNGDISTIDIESIKGPKTSAAAQIAFEYQPKFNIKANVSGNSYDLTDLFTKSEQKQKQNVLDNKNNEDDLASVPDTEIFIAVNSLWTNPDTPIKNFAGSATLKHGVGVEEMHIVGNHGSDKSIKFNLDYTPKPNGEYYLSIDSNNAGSTLRVLRFYENMTGGILKIEAKRGTDKKFIGHAKIRDFKIQNTPLMAKLLTVASFSGIIDLLKGDGLAFSHFDAPFTYQKQKLVIDDAKMFGNVIGFTATGDFNRASEKIDIKGIISPAYSLNSMVSKIPLVGKLLTGKDGTFLAVNYTITNTIDDPKININPLSILSPNSVKDLFKEDRN